MLRRVGGLVDETPERDEQAGGYRTLAAQMRHAAERMGNGYLRASSQFREYANTWSNYQTAGPYTWTETANYVAEGSTYPSAYRRPTDRGWLYGNFPVTTNASLNRNEWYVDWGPSIEPVYEDSFEAVRRGYPARLQNFSAVHVAEPPRDYPDPDHWLGMLFDRLQRQLFKTIMDHYEITSDDVWRNWTIEAVSRPPAPEMAPANDAWRHWTLEMRARFHGANQEPVTGRRAASIDRDLADATWEDWQRGITVYPGQSGVVPRRPSEADRRRQAHAIARRTLVAKTRRHAHALRQRIAERKARTLLLAMLTDEQRADLERASGFKVHVGDRVYEVAKGYAGNVYLLDEDGQRVERYCIHGPSYLPDEDQMLAQKLMLETDEERFLRVANMTPMAPSAARARARQARGEVYANGVRIGEVRDVQFVPANVEIHRPEPVEVAQVAREVLDEMQRAVA
jgi:hypothetical protein